MIAVSGVFYFVLILGFVRDLDRFVLFSNYKKGFCQTVSLALVLVMGKINSVWCQSLL